MDNLSSEHRHKNMQNIHSFNTKMEVVVRSELHKLGFRFRKHVKTLFGKPDIVLKKYNTVIFLDSCFWHMCPYHFILPKTNKKYWKPKLRINKERAKEVNKILRKNGWHVIRIWEHAVKKDLEKTINKIIKKIS